MYYCILCKKLHPLSYKEQEMIFKSGFHYYSSDLYPAGLCKPEPYPEPQDQPATAS